MNILFGALNTMTASTMPTRRALLYATAVLVCSLLGACGGNDRDTGPGESVVAPTPTPTPAPTPPPPPQHTATPAPFNLTESRAFDIWGWDSWPSAPTPSTIQLRWNAATGNYEVRAPGYADWSRLEALSNSFGGPPFQYDVFGSGGTQLPFDMLVVAPPHIGPTNGHVGNARIFEGSNARAYFAFGIATAPADVPVSGTMTCIFGEDEIGDGELTIDFGARTVSGWARPFWADVRYQLVQTSLTPGAATFATTFGTGGVLEGRFFGPRAANIAVRAIGGGQGAAGVSGMMTGACEG